MNSHSRAQSRFTHVQKQTPDGMQHYRVVKCADCGAIEQVRDAKLAGLPDEQIARILRFQGWLIGSRPGHDICPNCARAPQPEKPPSKLSPQQKRAAYLRITSEEAGKTPVSAQAPVKAAPPRTPTMSERRRVMGALEDHYDVEAQRYRQSWSDTALAQKLDVPRAWVTEVRTGFFGDSEACESDGQRDADILRLEADLAAVLEQLTRIEGEVRKLRGPKL